MLAGLQEAAGKERLEVVAVNFQDDRDVYRGLLRKLKDIQLTMTHDATGRIGDAYGVKGDSAPARHRQGWQGRVQGHRLRRGIAPGDSRRRQWRTRAARRKMIQAAYRPEVAFSHLIHHNSAPAAGWSSLAARRAHNPKVAGSNPAPATSSRWRKRLLGAFFVSGRVPMRAVATALRGNSRAFAVAFRRCRAEIQRYRTRGPSGPLLFSGPTVRRRSFRRHDGQGKRNRSAARTDRAIDRVWNCWASNICRRPAARCCGCTSTCRPMRTTSARSGSRIARRSAARYRRSSTSPIRSAAITRWKCRPRASTGRCSRRRSSLVSRARRRRSR